MLMFTICQAYVISIDKIAYVWYNGLSLYKSVLDLVQRVIKTESSQTQTHCLETDRDRESRLIGGNHMNFLENLGYLFLIVIVTGICFWQYRNTMNDRAANTLAAAGLTKKEIRKKQRARRKNMWLIGAIVAVWLIATFLAFGGIDAVFFFIVSIFSCIAIWYSLNNTDTMQLTAMKFLIAPIGLALGFYIGKAINLPGIWTYVIGILTAVILIAVTHFIHRAMVDDLDDDDEDDEDDDEEEPRPMRSYEDPNAGTYVRREAARQAVNGNSRNREGTPNNRHRRNVQASDETDHNLDAYIVEQLSRTEEGRQQLLDMLRRGN